MCVPTAFFDHEEVPVTVLDWRTRKCPRVCSSTLQAEAFATSEGLAAALWVRELFRAFLTWDYKVKQANSQQGPAKLETTVINDAASLYDYISKDVT